MRWVSVLQVGLGLAAFAPMLPAQDTTRVVLSGKVLDPLGKPVEGAEVRIVGSSQSVLSSPAGIFRLLVPPAGTLLVQIRRPGYNQQLLNIPTTWTGNILLTPGAVQLPDVAVTARYAKPGRYAGTSKYDEVFERRRLGLGELIDRDQIDQRAAQETAQLLEARAGIRVQISHSDMAGDFGAGTYVSFTRCNEYPPKINVYVDGRKQQPRLSEGAAGDGESVLSFMARKPTDGELERRRQVRMQVGELLDRVNPSDIEMIEIFRGPSELPPQFNDGNCGAIAVWTRQGTQ